MKGRTVRRLAGEILAGEDSEKTVVIEVFGNVANKQRKLRTETQPNSSALSPYLNLQTVTPHLYSGVSFRSVQVWQR